MASSIVISATKQLGGLLAQEARHLYEVSDKIESLQRDLEWMHCYLEDADNRQDGEKVVALWIAEIRDFAYEAEEIIKRYIHKVSNPRQNGACNTIRWLSCVLCDARALHEVGSNIDALRTRIKELISRLHLYGVKVTHKKESLYDNALGEQRQTYSHTEEEPIGLENHIEKVVKELVNAGQVKVVGIWEMGGLGKTTLARKVYQDATIKEHFKQRAWVCISKKFDPVMVFREILVGLTNAKGKQRNEIFNLLMSQLTRKICEILKQPESLVVLDDLWTIQDWNTLEHTFGSIESMSGKVLISTRDKGVMNYFHPFEYSHNPGILNKDDSWTLFKRIAFCRRDIAGDKKPTSDDIARNNDTSKEVMGSEGNELRLFHTYFSLRPFGMLFGRHWRDKEGASNDIRRKNDTSKENIIGDNEISTDDTRDNDTSEETAIANGKASSDDIIRENNTPKEKITSAASPLEATESDQAKQEDDEDMKTKEKLGKKMLEHCNGLPLAIKTLGGVLRSKKTIDEWKTVQQNIKSYLMGNMKQGPDSDRSLFSILELSYKELPYYLKPCFMYLANCPEDYEIKAERLYHLWEAEGLVTTLVDNGDEIEGMHLDDIAESYLNQLVERCLVQVSERWVNGRIKSCQLHDVMRDVCVMKSKDVNFVNIKKHGSSENSSRKIASSPHVNRKLRRCALHLEQTEFDDDLPFDPNPNIAPSKRSLLVFPKEKGSGPKGLLSAKMSEFCTLLWVLELQKTSIPVHPKTAREFIHLRYLSFRGATFCSSLPSPIWECKYLETLDLRWDTVDELSVSNKFRKLGRLRHLYLPNKMKLKGSRWLILTDKQLQQMETLKNFNVKVCKIEDLGKMASMRVFTFVVSTFLRREAVELFLKSPMVATKRLAKPMHLHVVADVINVKEASSLLTAIDDHVCITLLEIKGRIDAAANLEICQQFKLSKLLLNDSEIGQEGISVLDKLLS